MMPAPPAAAAREDDERESPGAVRAPGLSLLVRPSS